MKAREKKQFFVVIINNGVMDDVPPVDVSVINDRRALNAWLTGAGARAHSNALKGGKGWHQLSDGRECLIIEGHLRVTKSVVKVAIV